MVNNKLLQSAEALVIMHLESCNIPVETKAVRNRLLNWYNYTDIADPDLLAAAAIMNDYDCRYTYEDILLWYEELFCKIPVEYSGNISVNELRDYI
jgi:hypothetical protein